MIAWLLLNWKSVLSALLAGWLGVCAGYTAGNFLCHREGVNIGKDKAALGAAINGQKAGQAHERFKHETRTMDDVAVDIDLHNLGIVRVDSDL